VTVRRQRWWWCVPRARALPDALFVRNTPTHIACTLTAQALCPLNRQARPCVAQRPPCTRRQPRRQQQRRRQQLRVATAPPQARVMRRQGLSTAGKTSSRGAPTTCRWGCAPPAGARCSATRTVACHTTQCVFAPGLAHTQLKPPTPHLSHARTHAPAGHCSSLLCVLPGGGGQGLQRVGVVWRARRLRGRPRTQGVLAQAAAQHDAARHRRAQRWAGRHALCLCAPHHPAQQQRATHRVPQPHHTRPYHATQAPSSRLARSMTRPRARHLSPASARGWRR
jgi:hypothetical protein